MNHRRFVEHHPAAAFGHDRLGCGGFSLASVPNGGGESSCRQPVQLISTSTGVEEIHWPLICRVAWPAASDVPTWNRLPRSMFPVVAVRFAHKFERQRVAWFVPYAPDPARVPVVLPSIQFPARSGFTRFTIGATLHASVISRLRVGVVLLIRFFHEADATAIAALTHLGIRSANGSISRYSAGTAEECTCRRRAISPLKAADQRWFDPEMQAALSPAPVCSLSLLMAAVFGARDAAVPHVESDTEMVSNVGGISGGRKGIFWADETNFTDDQKRMQAALMSCREARICSAGLMFIARQERLRSSVVFRTDRFVPAFRYLLKEYPVRCIQTASGASKDFLLSPVSIRQCYFLKLRAFS